MIFFCFHFWSEFWNWSSFSRAFLLMCTFGKMPTSRCSVEVRWKELCCFSSSFCWLILGGSGPCLTCVRLVWEILAGLQTLVPTCQSSWTWPDRWICRFCSSRSTSRRPPMEGRLSRQRLWGFQEPEYQEGMVTNSVLFCWLFTNKDRCKNVHFQQTHIHGLCHFCLTVSLDLCA